MKTKLSLGNIILVLWYDFHKVLKNLFYKPLDLFLADTKIGHILRPFVLRCFGYKLAPKVMLSDHVVIGYTSTIGKNTFINKRVILDGTVHIGEHVQIGMNTVLTTMGHTLVPSEHKRRDDVKLDAIIIEDNVWIASNCIILPGVRIGKGSVIGAGSVVTKDIEAGVLAFGNPAKVHRHLEVLEENPND
ncbi:MAG: DapH/DapD/GlmU-related protein [Vampirovibrionales bacterium]